MLHFSVNRYQVVNWSAGEEKRRKCDTITRKNEKISGTGESNLIAGELRAYLKLQFEESVGPPATGKKWRRQSTEFHQVLVLTRGCDEAKQDQGVTVMTVNGI